MFSSLIVKPSSLQAEITSSIERSVTVATHCIFAILLFLTSSSISSNFSVGIIILLGTPSNNRTSISSSIIPPQL